MEGKEQIPLFLFLSGAHQYGFADETSDFDVRGIHLTPTQEVLGFNAGKPLEFMEDKLDLVSYELKHALSLLLKSNHNVLENILCCQVLYEGENLAELRRLASQAVTRKMYMPYKGFSFHTFKQVEKEDFRVPKRVLYVIRTLLSGIYTMQTGRIESNIHKLWVRVDIREKRELKKVIDTLIRAKKERVEVPLLFRQQLRLTINSLFEDLDNAYNKSVLPSEIPSYLKNSYNNYLIKMRLKYLKQKTHWLFREG